jgi:hypothetical protein
MSKDSIALINGHEYKYRYNKESGGMDYLGPVGDAPAITQREFQRAMTMESDVKKFLSEFKGHRSGAVLIQELEEKGVSEERINRWLSGKTEDTGIEISIQDNTGPVEFTRFTEPVVKLKDNNIIIEAQNRFDKKFGHFKAEYPLESVNFPVTERRSFDYLGIKVIAPARAAKFLIG